MAVPGEPLALLRPGEAAAALGVRPSTLRVYVQRFGELLSDEVASAERPGYRFYTTRDIEMLRLAKDLLARGFTYEQTLAQIRPTRAEPVDQPPRRRRRRP